ncbi:MAG: hypothetical protein SOY73_08630 [Blautia sp.]|nr:hypothetical protein [Blautia sp.]
MKKKFSKIQKLITVAVSVATVLVSSITVFAYEPLQSSNEETISNLTDGDFIEFITAEEANNEIFSTEDYFLYGDMIFISDEGETFILDNIVTPHAICNHTFINGTLNKHASNGSGGCTVYVYNAQRCTKCNYIKTLDLIQTNIYTVCPHNS